MPDAHPLLLAASAKPIIHAPIVRVIGWQAAGRHDGARRDMARLVAQLSLQLSSLANPCSAPTSSAPTSSAVLSQGEDMTTFIARSRGTSCESKLPVKKPCLLCSGLDSAHCSLSYGSKASNAKNADRLVSLQGLRRFQRYLWRTWPLT